MGRCWWTASAGCTSVACASALRHGRADGHRNVCRSGRRGCTGSRGKCAGVSPGSRSGHGDAAPGASRSRDRRAAAPQGGSRDGGTPARRSRQSAPRTRSAPPPADAALACGAGVRSGARASRRLRSRALAAERPAAHPGHVAPPSTVDDPGSGHPLQRSRSVAGIPSQPERRAMVVAAHAIRTATAATLRQRWSQPPADDCRESSLSARSPAVAAMGLAVVARRRGRRDGQPHVMERRV